jgi:Rne/Rng family ribonuclease
MSKELIISVAPQETKAAILENDQVLEIYIERDKEQHGIVGSICKGRVTKVLPGMQSAFVEIGLERDAFLYVSDFFEDTEEYDKIVSTAEDQVAKLEQGIKDVVSPVPESVPAPPQPGLVAPNVVKYHDGRGRSRRSRRNRLRGKRYDEGQHPAGRPNPRVVTPEAPSANVQEFPSILPGESLAKYQKPTAAPLEDKPERAENSPETAQVVEYSHPDPFPFDAEGAETFQSGETSPFVEPSPLTTPEILELQASESSEISATRERPEEPTTPVEPTPSAFLLDAKAVIPVFTPTPEVTSAEQPVIIAGPEQTTQVGGEQGQVEDVSSNAAVAGATLAAAGQESTEVAQPGFGAKIPSPTSIASKIQFRNSPNTSRFFKRNVERKRRFNPNDPRGEAEWSPNFPLIGDLLKEGQEILVQISKEPLGTKGARITSHIALPGRYLVYMPTVDHIGVSRKIDSEEERQRLKRIIQENRGGLVGGFIVRTAGQNKGEEEFKSDIKYLSALWAEIRSKSDKKAAPAVIHRDLNLIQRLLRDQLSGDFSAIRVDNEVEYAAIVEFIGRFQPSIVNRVKLYQKETPIFEEFGVQAEIDKALRSKVWLKSGGYIVIDQAEALVAIDVNTGKYVGKSNKLEDTIVKTNIEAAKEIARQIRLRDLGGIIVCDFIDMEDRKNRQKVTQTLEEALRSDKSPSKTLQFNDFGLVAITRKRVKQSLLKVLCEPCSECGGTGMVKSPQTICYEIQSEVKKMAKLLENREITIRVNPEVAKELKTDEASVINEIESSLKKEVIIKSDPLLHQEHFDIF